MSDWSSWSNCNKKCGGGTKEKSRTILYPQKYGGRGCPTLKAHMSCNTHECLNPNFKKVVLPKQKKIVLPYGKVYRGCPPQTFVQDGKNWKGPNRKLIRRGNQFFCCREETFLRGGKRYPCNKRYGGWFAYFSVNAPFLKKNF